MGVDSMLYLRPATITFKVWQEGLLFEGGDYSRAASDRGNTVLDGWASEFHGM